jgi:hypothetical protein
MSLIITDGLPRGLGYVEIDQRGVNAALPVGTPRHFEADTYTCTHCQTVVVLNPLRVRERYKCNGCNHHICDPCAAERVAGKGCKTFEQVVDEVMEQTIRQSDSGLIIQP